MGSAGQPFLIWAVWDSRQWGVAVVAGVRSAGPKGLWVHWIARRPSGIGTLHCRQSLGSSDVANYEVRSIAMQASMKSVISVDLSKTASAPSSMQRLRMPSVA